MGVCIGVDVSKHHLDWARGGEGAVARLVNTPVGVSRPPGDELASSLHEISQETLTGRSSMHASMVRSLRTPRRRRTGSASRALHRWDQASLEPS